MHKTCTKCGVEKPATAEYFPRTKAVKSGLCSRCKVCANEYNKQYTASKPVARQMWLEANSDRLKEYKRQHRIENLDRYSEMNRKWAEDNKESLLAYNKEYYTKHRDRIAVNSAEYRKTNADKISRIGKEYRDKNRDKIRTQQHEAYLRDKDKRKQYSITYRANNKHKKTAWNKSYALSKINRTPSWITEDDNFLIHEIYHLASLRTEATGVEWQVDHILPLQGKKVSGLHVPTNLQVIPAVVNNKKRNKFTPGDFPVKTNFFGEA